MIKECFLVLVLYNAHTNDAGATIEITGKFTLVIKQKKDKMAGLIVEGGYAAE